METSEFPNINFYNQHLHGLFDIFVASHSCPLVVGWFLIGPFSISNSIQTDSKKKNIANGLFLLYYLLKVKEISLYFFIYLYS